MALKIGILKETASDERRVALVPEVTGQLVKDGVEVIVEAGAGVQAFHADTAYEEAGARVASRAEALEADVVVVVQPPVEDLEQLREGQAILGFLAPLDRPEVAEKLATRGVTALAMELVPRISRAQKMDALSAMSSIAGYRAVLLAATHLPRFFPLLTTAAGTIQPANVLVIGAGVAGLQAIATAKRLGARVAGYDVRPAVREEVQSLGAGFLELELELDTGDTQTEEGYAKELEKEKQERQPELLTSHVGRADVVITTALIPGRPAPQLINEAAVEGMKPGSVVVDLAAPNGGNCALTVPGETVTRHDVTLLGPLNLPAEMPEHASALYTRTVAALLEEFTDEEEGFVPDPDDEIFQGCCVARDGAVVHERVQQMLAA